MNKKRYVYLVEHWGKGDTLLGASATLSRAQTIAREWMESPRRGNLVVLRMVDGEPGQAVIISEQWYN